ncbi:DUF4178 domain-containing protein [Thermopolyspora flexuosa]|jgi:hypothetical protein|uniref:Uncharacterized protein DUF4178 n=1 Tax=Thermopolyspora flexuosa TaxID=103836 RepID=A0A543IT66_9ACTN|nr:DUF4178 domain-containing protein [Thermopolyspora flexuosa]TQM73732.1 uncharacterized protein DUF4178 [Thermopolyspora flexuosa]
MTAAVVLILSIATLVVVLGAYIATTRQDRREAAQAAKAARRTPAEPAMPNPAPVPEPPPDYFDPRTIKVGDFIECQGTRSRVLGALHKSTRQGDHWTEYLLDDGSRVYQRLSVREKTGPDPDSPAHLEVMLWTQVPTQGMVPAKSTLILEGVEFAPLERGTVAFRSEGMTMHPDRGLMDYADYRATDGRRLSFERVQGQPWTAAYALPLPPGSIKVERLP